MQTLVDVKNLVFEYPGKRVINDTSFSLNEGTVTALVGPNGAGKTTLMKCLAAAESPLSGSIKILDMDTEEKPRECRSQIGFLPDTFGLYPTLTVHQHLEFMAGIHNVSTEQIANRIFDSIQLLNLQEHCDKPAGNLSRGLKQRLAIAMTIIHRPKLLILDEPASGLDPEARKELSSLITGLNKEGMTILVSSHILSELEDYCTTLLTCGNGKILANEDISPRIGAKIIIEIRIINDAVRAKNLLIEKYQLDQLNLKDNLLTFSFSSKQEDQNELLNFLILNKVPIYSFTEIKRDLHDLYFQHLKDSK